MRHQRLNYVAVGVFTLAMLGGVFVAILRLGGRTGPEDAYYMVVDNVADVKYGTQVRYEGFPIGQVQGIAPFPEGGRMRFRVALGIRRGWKVPVDSIARVGSSSLLAAKTVDITAGHDPKTIEPGNAIPAAPRIDMFAVLASVAAEVGDLSRSGLKPMVQDVRRLASRLGSQVETDVGKVMGSLQDTILTLHGRAAEISKRLVVVSQRLEQSSAGLERLMSEGNLASVERTLANVEATTASLKATGAGLRSTKSQVDALLADIRGTVRDNRGSVDKSITNVEYTLRSIAQTIDSVMINVDATSRNMSEFSRLIRQSPGVLLRGSRPDPVAPARARGGEAAN